MVNIVGMMFVGSSRYGVYSTYDVVGSSRYGVYSRYDVVGKVYIVVMVYIIRMM
jgi:hypothetical protein